MSQKQQVCEQLKKWGIPFECIDHPAVFTVEEMHALEFPPGTRIAKNLFLRDAKGKRHFLVTVEADQPVNLKELEGVLGSTKLSFGSEERLQKHLGLTKGSVTPFGLLNDPAQNVEFFLDEALAADGGPIGVHPNDNTATILISPENLVKAIEATGHEVNRVRF